MIDPFNPYHYDATIAEKTPQEFDLEVWKKYTKTTLDRGNER